MNLTVGNPYFNPHVNRPFAHQGAPLPEEHPLVGIARFTEVVRGAQMALPEMAMIGGGYSWLRQFLPALAAANVRKKAVTLVGLGRMAFAYPDAVRDLMRTGKLDPRKVCIACSACTQIMRDSGRSGCVPRDARYTGPSTKPEERPR